MLESIPTSLTAGESLALRLSPSACPASQGWMLRWVVKNGAAIVADIQGAPDGDAHLLTLTAQASEALPTLELQWQLWGAKASAGLSHLLETGRLPVRPGVSGDSRTMEERVLANLEAALERLAQDDETEVEISGRKMVFKDPAKVQELINVYRAKVRVQRGGSGIRMIPVRFR